MEIRSRIMDKSPTTRMGQSQNATDKTSDVSPAKETAPPKKQDSLELSAKGQAQVAEEQKTESQTSGSGVTSSTASQTDVSASSFASTSEYLAYLTDTYPSITNSNVQISETVLQQAMSDPAKETVLTDFLTELDGVQQQRYDQIAGMSDDTYTYELKSFGIQLDSIADDNSGINGSEFGEAVVMRKDGEPIGDEEFATLKSNFMEQYEELTDKQNERIKKMLDILLERRDDKNVGSNRKEPVEIDETERLEDIVNKQIEEKHQKMRDEVRRETQEKMNEELRQTMHGQNYSAKI